MTPSTRMHTASRPRAPMIMLFAILLVLGGMFFTMDSVFMSNVREPLSQESKPIEIAPSPTRLTPGPQPTKRSMNVSLLHPRTTPMPPLQGERISLTPTQPVSSTDGHIVESTRYFAQHGRNEQGIHYKLENRAVLDDVVTIQKDAVLIMVVLNDKSSWGINRTCDDFFTLIDSFTHPKKQTAVAMLTSSEEEFHTIQTFMRTHITKYAQFSLLFRNDFKAFGLTRKNRHDDDMQAARRMMLARYRNFALLSTLESWHQHVVWLDADVHIVPSNLVTKMIQSNRDIVEPICFEGSPPSKVEYDRNAWAGRRAVPGKSNADVRFMIEYREFPEEFIPLDSVGGTMLYVRADIHRQGVLFTTNYVIGTGWDSNGYDGIETEGLCYVAHFLGYKCWGMPHHPIYHAPNVW